MEDLVERLTAVRENDELGRAMAELFDNRAGKEEFRRPGPAEFTMTHPGEILYSME